MGIQLSTLFGCDEGERAYYPEMARIKCGMAVTRIGVRSSKMEESLKTRERDIEEHLRRKEIDMATLVASTIVRDEHARKANKKLVYYCELVGRQHCLLALDG